ncbi:MAG: hypothetical protein IT486_02580 [Gammaproteobacteria bacterium]|nr:hypothetical protein [Gammaproteobacteria bacterium]
MRREGRVRKKPFIESRSTAVIEAKKAATNPGEAADQGKAYGEKLGVPYVVLANGEEIRFWEYDREPFPRLVKTFFSQDDLERWAATRIVRKDPMSVPIDKKIVERDYQTDCINALCREMTDAGAAQAARGNGNGHGAMSATATAVAEPR